MSELVRVGNEPLRDGERATMSATAPITAAGSPQLLRSADGVRVVVVVPRYKCESDILAGSEGMANWIISNPGGRGGVGADSPRGGAWPNSAAAREKQGWCQTHWHMK